MKSNFDTPWKCLASLCVVITYFLTVSAAQAQDEPILLTINISNPNYVIISSTGNDPSQSVSGSIGAGFDLMGVLGTSMPTMTDLNFYGNLTSTLTTGATGTERVFNSDVYDNLNGQNDINIYNTGETMGMNVGMTFNTSDPAFEGTAVATDWGALTLLPVGSIGNIETGYNGSNGDPTYNTPNTVIGSFEVTPEPASWTLALIVTAVLAGLRFRLRRA